ncbi:MAG: hypothetical protein FJ290_12385 [Planctomycetes bacterium]|nr:hypothetical protein [Planctomycetota bacterium]
MAGAMCRLLRSCVEIDRAASELYKRLAVSVGAAATLLEGDVTLAIEELMHRSDEDMRAVERQGQRERPAG